MKPAGGEALRAGAFHTEEWAAVQADRVQLQQVLLNLLMNSVEAMNEVPAGGPKNMGSRGALRT